MGRKVLAAGMIVAVFIATAVIVVGYSGQRTVYQPINLMGGTPAGIANVNLAQAPTDAINSTDLNPPAIAAITSSPVLVGARLHTVQRGETLYRIAQQYNLTAEEIAAANALTDPGQIDAGQTLVIPGQAVTDGNPLDFTAQVASSSVLIPDQRILQTPAPTYPPAPTRVNEIAVETIIWMPPGVVEHIRNIYSLGQSMGRNPRALSKLGASTIENPHFLTRFDSGPYNLGEYAYLQDVINVYVGSFSRTSAVQRGLHTWSVLDPMWAGGSCQGGENLLACELRVQNPSVILIHLGSNDVGVPKSMEESLREIVETCMANGVIPILGTKADRHEGSNINNEITRQVAADYNVPLWDFDAVAATLPGKGLDGDGTHLTPFFAHDWRSPVAFQRGYGLMNLTALIALDRVWRAVTSP